jgi:sialate O-acetylesterase
MKKLLLPPLFSDGMIMQQGAAFPIRGRSIPLSAVSVTFLGKTYQTQAGADGKWQILLDPVQAGGPFTMDIESAETRVCIKDIYSGDVWLCAGQSNMEHPMQRHRDNYQGEWTAQAFPPIRQFKAPQEWDFSGPREELSGGGWTVATAETLHEFSVVAWFFARNLYEKYHLPIGLICTAWGGTPIEAWMSREALAAFPEKIAQGEQYADPAVCKEIGAKNEEAIQGWEGQMLREDEGLKEKWQSPETSLSDWDDITLPGDFAEAGQGADRPLSNFCGVIWLCREFEVKADFAVHDARVWLGTIVDSDTVYINGVEVGNTGYRYPPRKYRIPAGLLHEGKNRIVIRVTCVNGEGGITRDKPFRVFSEQSCVELAGKWKYRIGVKAPPHPEAFFFQRQPMGPFNATIAPILKFPLRGVIWYQGESNDRNPNEYEALFKAMIQDWRNKSGQASLPFLFVQLPIFGSPAENDEAASWAIIREAQSAALSLPVTGMAAGLDLGEWNDLHPSNKKEVGRRLFLAAERVVFKNEKAPASPICRDVQLRGSRLFLTFDNCGSGLIARDTPYVSVAADGKRGACRLLLRLPAEIEKHDTLSVDLSSVKKPEKILYAWANNPKDRQLYNCEGLPVIPFRITLFGSRGS